MRDRSDLTLGQLRAYTHDLLALSAQVDRPRPTTAWLHLVQYPVQAAAQMAVKHVGGMMARHGLAPWIVSDAAHDSIQALTARYNNGRWEGFMDAQPRRLPVFERVPHTTSAEPLLTRDTALWEQTYSLERIDSTRTITFEAEAEEGDMLCVELSLLPTHPRSGGRLIVELCLDGGEPQRLDFTVGDRDERWKQHVLRNRATEAMHAPAHGGKVHDIALTVREGGEVYIEEIRVKKSTLTR